jgi:hypothetical protein
MMMVASFQVAVYCFSANFINKTREETMEKSASRKLTLVTVFALVVLALLLLLVPGIANGTELSYVGIVPDIVGDEIPPGLCWMIDPGDSTSKPVFGEVTIQLAPPGSSLPSDAPPDVVALLRCKTTFSSYTGPAVTYGGLDTYGCWAFFEDSPEDSAFSSFWTQTVSASGNAVLTCPFKSQNLNY